MDLILAQIDALRDIRDVGHNATLRDVRDDFLDAESEDPGLTHFVGLLEVASIGAGRIQVVIILEGFGIVDAVEQVRRWADSLAHFVANDGVRDRGSLPVEYRTAPQRDAVRVDEHAIRRVAIW